MENLHSPVAFWRFAVILKIPLLSLIQEQQKRKLAAMSMAVPVNLAPASASAPAPAGAAGALPRTDVLGVGISAVNMTLAVDTIASWIKERSRQYVCITGVHGVMESQNDPHLKAIHNAAGMVTPDGMPMVWLSRLAGHRHVSLWEESYASGCFASLYGVYFDHRYPQGA